MIIEPTPTSPRTPIRRVLRVVGLVLPVVLLGVIVGAGLLGPRPEPTPTAASPVALLASARPASSVPATPGPIVAVEADEAVFPVAFEDLPVVDIEAVLGARAGSPQGAAVAVSGFIRVDGSADEGCADEPPGSMGPWCERLGILAASPWTSAGLPTGSFRSHPHLHLSIPPGVRLPQAIEAAQQQAEADVAQVLVIGRFAPAAAGCARAPRLCRDTFIVERFAWADGVRVGLTPLIADPLQTGTRRANPFAAALGDSELPLAAVLTWPDGIARLNPDTAALAAAGPPSEPLWYVRVLENVAAPGGDRLVRWMLLADRDFRVIGYGRVPAATADTPGPGKG